MTIILIFFFSVFLGINRKIMNYLVFQETFSKIGIFTVKHINLMFPGFNKDNLLNCQKKGYIVNFIA